MKKVFLLLVVVVTAINFSYGQWTDDGTNVYLTNSSRNVSIGSPSIYKMFITQNFTDLAGGQYSPFYVYAGWAPTANDMAGQGKALEFHFTKFGSYNVGYIHGTAAVLVNNGTGNVTYANSFTSYITNLNTGTISNARAFYALSPAATATNLITNAYGLYLESQKGTGVSNGYGVFQAGTNDLNYFAGKILIGKTSQVNTSYILDVNGNVRANQIVVNNTGADFVFEPSYKLYSLTQLEKYISVNHHLPEIPSAKEMQTDGLNIGDNQAKLLQKIEELTLYLIEKDNQIRDSNRKNRLLIAKMGALGKRLNKLEKKIKN